MNSNKPRTYLRQRTEYAELAAETKELLEELEGALNNHKQSAQSRENWGHWGNNGDLQHVNNVLVETLGFLSGDDELADGGIAEYHNRK